jgi:RHS repeat-associated protein
VSRIIDSLGRITDMTYDPAWNKVATVTRYLDNGTAVTSSNTYHPVSGNLMTSTSPEGYTTIFTYTAKGQVETVTNPLGHVTRFEYNLAGDLTKTTDPLNNEVQMEPDLAGRITRIIDPLNFVTRIERNGLDQTTKIIDADMGETVLAYNTKHQLASITDPQNQVVERYDYDELYRPTQRTDASGKVETTRYDATGLADRHTDRRGQVTSSTFDEKDRPLITTFADGSTIRRTYDAVGRLSRVVRSGAGLDESFLYTLDNADRLIQLARTAGSRTDTITYQYDSLNRVTQRSVNGEITTYTYDKAGRILAVQHRGQSTRYAWDAASRLTEKTLPNNLKQQMVYDNAGRLTSLIYKSAADAIIEQIDYGYDNRGQRISKTTLGTYPVVRDTPIEASYDSANRLTSLTLKGVGVPATPGGLPTDETYSLSYDDNGNLTEKRGQGTASANVTTFTWDKQNRLIGMTQAGASPITASFSYDQFGRRVSKSINGSEVKFTYDGDQAVAEEANGVSTSQLTGLAIDEHIARYSGQEQLIYLTDALGSIIAQAKADGTIQNKYGYSPYGQVETDADDKGNPHQYTGRENDKTGLYFYRARYYMPSCGRFISEDPIGTSGGLNVYAYVSGNPITRRDPSGLWSTDAHNEILRKLYEKCLTQDSLRALEIGSLQVDGDSTMNFFRNQVGGDPAQHAMRRPGETPQEAERRMIDFINAELNLARRNPVNAFVHYGRALHPIMDSTSPLHEGFQQWPHLRAHGPFGEGVRHLTDGRFRQTEQAVQRYAPELNDLCKAY